MQRLTAMSASLDDLHRLLGDVDPLIAERIIATGASAEEIDEALREIQDEHGFGEIVHNASSPRVAEVRAVLEDDDVLGEEDGLDELEAQD
jgi:hypothetical protein